MKILASLPVGFAFCSISRPGQIALPMLIGRAWVRKTSKTRPIFRARTFGVVKKKKSLDLQIYSRLGKPMKKLQ